MATKEMFAAMARALADAVRARRVPHMLIGGLAVAVHGRPRFTKDIDLVVSLSTSEVAPFLAELSARGFEFALEDMASRLLAPGQVGRVRFGPGEHSGQLHADLMIVLPGYEQQALARASECLIMGATFRVASAEDLLLSKVVAGRPMDHADAEAIVARRGSDLDLPYLRRCAADLAASLEQPELPDRVELLLRQVPPPR